MGLKLVSKTKHPLVLCRWNSSPLFARIHAELELVGEEEFRSHWLARLCCLPSTPFRMTEVLHLIHISCHSSSSKVNYFHLSPSMSRHLHILTSLGYVLRFTMKNTFKIYKLINHMFPNCLFPSFSIDVYTSIELNIIRFMFLDSSWEYFWNI